MIREQIEALTRASGLMLWQIVEIPYNLWKMSVFPYYGNPDKIPNPYTLTEPKVNTQIIVT